MNKVILFAFGPLLVLLAQGQSKKVQFIDSMSHRIDKNNIILLFSELPDTADLTTGVKFSQRNSYYYDWRQKELRLIDVYRFDNVTSNRVAKRAFRKNKKVPSGTEIQYLFFRNKLVKVKVSPSEGQCANCFGEILFFKRRTYFQK